MDTSVVWDTLSPISNKLVENHAISKSDLPEKELLNSKLRNGGTLLHIAVTVGNIHNIKVLLEAGADVKSEDRLRNTPLHYATTPDVVELLIENGSKISVENNMGHTLLDIVLYSGNYQLLEYLLEKKLFESEKVAKRFRLKKNAKVETIVNAFLVYVRERDAHCYDSDFDM